MELDFLIIDDFKGSITTITTNNLSDKICEELINKSKFSSPLSPNSIQEEIKLISIENRLLAFIYNHMYDHDQKNEGIQISWIIIFDKNQFLAIHKSIRIIQEKILPELRKHILESIEMESFDEFRKKAKKFIKKLPVRINRLIIDESTLHSEINEDFITMRAKSKKYQETLDVLLDGIFYCPQIIINYPQEKESIQEIIDCFIHFIYYIIPTEIIFTFNYSGYEMEIKNEQSDIQLMKVYLGLDSEENLGFKMDLVDKQKCLIEVDDSKLVSSFNSSEDDVDKGLSKFLIKFGMEVVDIEDIIRCEQFIRDFLKSTVFKSDIKHFRTFLKENINELEDLSHTFKTQKTQIMGLYSSFILERMRYDFIKYNQQKLEEFQKIYENYSKDSESNKKFFEKLLDNLALDNEDQVLLVNFQKFKDLIDTIKKSPFPSIKGAVITMLDTLKVPDWLIELRRFDIISKVDEIKAMLGEKKELMEISKEIQGDPGLKIKLREILGDYYINRLRKYSKEESSLFLNSIMELLIGNYDYFLVFLTVNENFIDTLKNICAKLLLNLEKEKRTNDYLILIQISLWYKILHGIETPLLESDDELNSMVGDLQEIINNSLQKEGIVKYGWKVPYIFKDLFIKILEPEFLEKFQEFKADFADFHDNVYKEITELKKNYSTQDLTDTIESMIESDIDDKEEFELKYRNAIKSITDWNKQYKPPRDVYELLNAATLPENEDKITRLHEESKLIDDMILNYSDLLNVNELVQNFKGYLIGKNDLKDINARIELIRQLQDTDILNILTKVDSMNRPELTKEIFEFIKGGKYSDTTKLALKHYTILDKIQEDKENVYSIGFKDNQLTEALNTYLETKRPLWGFLDYSEHSQEIEEILKKKLPKT